eukprot:NODE_878_length_3347_cov_1.268781.p1 type:complete len:720 gc:universal NODE_878_length_3347_cov_1.268781:381-2540(+)
MFKNFGLSDELLKGVVKSNYKQPTPIQRKAIPVLMNRTNVIVQSRTGSGKSAAFLIPLINHLKSHSNAFGCRALVLSPTRELALQLYSHYKLLATYTNLRSILLVGGDNLDDQFSAFSSNPDVIFATPGRLLHVLVEMDRKLPVEFLIYDEVDRLFEQGFAVQLHEILERLPSGSKRITGFFSATLPPNVLEFTQSVCTDPVLIKLDADQKLSENLSLEFFYCIPEYKNAALLYIIQNLIGVPKGQQELEKVSQFAGEKQTIVFCATKHHVEYLTALLESQGFAVAYLYGTLDQGVRNMQVSRFRAAQCPILITTDIAARGIDIPILKFVINYELTLPKIFVHRVGRVARAGRDGTAYSLCCRDDLPYFFDINSTIGNDIVYGENAKIHLNDMRIGCFPKFCLDPVIETLQRLLDPNLSILKSSADNSQKKYFKSITKATSDGYSFAKEILNSGNLDKVQKLLTNEKGYSRPQQEMLTNIYQYRPRETIFEVGFRKSKSQSDEVIKKAKNSIQMRKHVKLSKLKMATFKPAQKPVQSFESHINDYKDTSFYLEFKDPSQNDSTSFPVIRNSNDIEDVSLALPDDVKMKSGINKKLGKMSWDTKQRKFVKLALGKDNRKLIKTESGTVLPASYKSDRYDKWKKKTNISIPRDRDGELSESNTLADGNKFLGKNAKFKRIHGKTNSGSHKNKAGIKHSSTIAKDRNVKEKLRRRNGRHKKK